VVLVDPNHLDVDRQDKGILENLKFGCMLMLARVDLVDRKRM
jgi:hypothetical protein